MNSSRWPLGFPEPRISCIPDGSEARAEAAIGLAALAGVDLFEWQRFALRATLRRSDGYWSSFENVWIVPRQNGKSVGLGIRALAGALLFNERLVIVSAHQWRSVVELFRATCDLIAGSPLCRYLKGHSPDKGFRRAGGEEAIEFENGNRIRFMNRSKETARGFSADCVIMDEAHTVTGEQMDAMLPVMSAQLDPQVIYACAGPAPESWYLSRLRSRVLNGDHNRLCWLEWSGDPDGDVEDENMWLDANPASAAGRQRLERMREERVSLGFDGFKAERLACAPWPSEMEGAYQLFSPDDVRSVFGRPG